MVTQVVLNNFTFVEIDSWELPHKLFSFQKALQANALRLLMSLAADALLDPRYLKSVTWLMDSP